MLFDSWLITGVIWIVAAIYLVFSIIAAFQILSESISYDSGKRKASIIRGIKDEYFFNQKYFTLYDILRIILLIPAILGATLLFIITEGAVHLFPFLRQVLGFKLFRIQKED